MRYAKFIAILLPTVMIFSTGQSALSGECGCCAHCGCSDGCEKICRLVREEKKVEVTCWGCKCEDFCVGGPSCEKCRHCKMVCENCDENCDENAVYSKPKRFVWTEWVPGCAHM